MQYRFKASETLLGIETQHDVIRKYNKLGFKASETLLGIETARKAIARSFTSVRTLQSL